MFVLCSFSDPSHLRCLRVGEGWEVLLCREWEEQSWRWHLPVGTEMKGLLVPGEAYLSGHTMGLSAWA
jgi:hypothetical protein